MKCDMLTLGNNLEWSTVILIVSVYFCVEKLNVNKKIKNGAEKTDKDFFVSEMHLKDLNYSCFMPSIFVTR